MKELERTAKWIIPTKLFTIDLKEIGRGSCSIFYSGTYCGTSVAIKSLTVSSFSKQTYLNFRKYLFLDPFF